MKNRDLSDPLYHREQNNELGNFPLVISEKKTYVLHMNKIIIEKMEILFSTLYLNAYAAITFPRFNNKCGSKTALEART